MHINIGDKLVVAKELNGFLNGFFEVGEIVEVSKIDTEKDTITLFKMGENFTKTGTIDATTCFNYFKKLSTKEETRTPTITEEYVSQIMENSEFDVYTVFDKCTVVSCKLPNGFVISEYSACVDPRNYDEDLGMKICFNKIADKILELEAYRLQCESECCCGNDEEFDECLDTDLDCDNCTDNSCPHNNNK